MILIKSEAALWHWSPHRGLWMTLHQGAFCLCQREDRRGSEPRAEKTSFPIVKGFTENNQECELLSCANPAVDTPFDAGLAPRCPLRRHVPCAGSGAGGGESKVRLQLLPIGAGGDSLKPNLFAGARKAEMSCGLWWFSKRLSFQRRGCRWKLRVRLNVKRENIIFTFASVQSKEMLNTSYVV